MAGGATFPADDRRTETSEAAYRRIARRKLIERGVAEELVEAKLTELLRKGLPIDPVLLTER